MITDFAAAENGEAPSIGPAGEGLVFLLGLPRSGTTLLASMLGRHRDIASPPEPWVMLALEALGRVSVRHPANSQVLGKAIRDFAPPDRLRAAQAAAARCLYDAHLAETGKRLFLDKTPRYWLIVDHLAVVFPAARFLWLVRDPLDVAASHRSTWGLDLPALLTAGEDEPALFDFTVGLARLEAFSDRHPERVRRLSYEALVADPVGELAGLLVHLGRATGEREARAAAAGLTDLATPDGRSADPNHRADRFGDPKILTTHSPHTHSVGNWRESFSPDALRILLEAVGTARLERLGYGATAAALRAMGIRERDPDLHLWYHDNAARRLAARWEDVRRAGTHCTPLAGAVQARVHAALAGDAAWHALAGADGPLAGRLDALSRRLAEMEAEIARLKAAAG